jgi:hypothetical protein
MLRPHRPPRVVRFGRRLARARPSDRGARFASALIAAGLGVAFLLVTGRAIHIWGWAGISLFALGVFFLALHLYDKVD